MALLQLQWLLMTLMLAIGTAGIGVANSCFWNVKLKANRLICLINIPLESMQQWERVVSVTMLRSGARGRKTHYCMKAIWGSWRETRVLHLGWGRNNACFSQDMVDICFSSAGGPKSDHLKCCAPQLRAARAATMFNVCTAACSRFLMFKQVRAGSSELGLWYRYIFWVHLL